MPKGPNRLEMILEERSSRLKEKEGGSSPTPGLVLGRDSLAQQKQKLEQEIQGALEELTALKNNWAVVDLPSTQPAGMPQPRSRPAPAEAKEAARPEEPAPEESKPETWLDSVKSWFR